MISYIALCALRSIITGEMTAQRFAEAIIGRSAKVPTMVATFVRPVIEELLTCGLIEVYDLNGIRMVAVSPLGLRFYAETEQEVA